MLRLGTLQVYLAQFPILTSLDLDSAKPTAFRRQRLVRMHLNVSLSMRCTHAKAFLLKKRWHLLSEAEAIWRDRKVTITIKGDIISETGKKESWRDLLCAPKIEVFIAIKTKSPTLFAKENEKDIISFHFSKQLASSVIHLSYLSEVSKVLQQNNFFKSLESRFWPVVSHHLRHQIKSHEETSSLTQTLDRHLGRGQGRMADQAKPPSFSKERVQIKFPGSFSRTGSCVDYSDLTCIHRRWLSHLMANNRWK